MKDVLSKYATDVVTMSAFNTDFFHDPNNEFFMLCKITTLNFSMTMKFLQKCST
jgi:hypothetical protein